MYRTKNLGELRIENIGEIVELAGIAIFKNKLKV